MSAATGRQLFVGNLPFIIGWQDLKDLFREAGNVVRADVVVGPAGRSRGFGTVLYATTEEAQAAIDMFNNYEWNGRNIEVREDRAVSGANGTPVPQIAIGAAPVLTGNGNGNGNGNGSINVRALYVGNIPYTAGWQDLKDLFRQAGNVVRADIPTDFQGRSKGFGTIVMGSVEEARKAASMLNGYEWNGRRMDVREDRNFVEGGTARGSGGGNMGAPGFDGRSVDQSGPRENSGGNYRGSDFERRDEIPFREPTQRGNNVGNFRPSGFSNSGGFGGGNGSTAGRQLFVGNLPFTVQWQELKDLFREAGNVLRADITIDNQGRSRGYGQVLMATVEEAQGAIQLLNGRSIMERTIEVREDKFAAEGSGNVPGTQVYVGNLPYSSRWQDLKDMFRPAGFNPVYADVMVEPVTGRSKGCGIVRFSTPEEADRAVQQINGTNVNGRNVIVRLDKFA